MINDFILERSNILRRHAEAAKMFGPLWRTTSYRFTATSFRFGDPRAQTYWSKAVYVYALQNMALTMLMGKSKNSVIQVENKLLTRKGGTIIFESRSPMSGAGQGDDGNTTGREESLKRRNMSLTVHERAHSVVSAGKMSEQLTATDIREAGREDLGEWWAEALENDLITCAAGLYNENSSGSEIQTINESYPTWRTNQQGSRIYYGGQTAAGVIGTSYTTDALLTAGSQDYNLMGTLVLEKVARLAIASTPRFRACKIYDISKSNPDYVGGGIPGPLIGNFFLVLLHPLQIKAIKAESGTVGWKAMCAQAQNRGNQNPIFSHGNAFLWDNMLCWQYDRIPQRTGAGGTTLAEGFLLNTARTATDDAVADGDVVCRTVLFGAQALSFGWAQRLEWSEDFVDNNKPKIKVDALLGVKRTQFNAHGTETPGPAEAIYCIDTEVIAD
jgi:N4-gp56 family major capsid protein